MVYSVWNPGTRLYDYYATGEVNRDVHAPTPRHIRQSSQLGATVESAAWRLPAGARPAGRGALPRGRIAVSGGGALGFFDIIDLPLPVLLVGGYVAWRMFGGKLKKAVS